MTKSEGSIIALPELEEPFCCSKAQELDNSDQDSRVPSCMKIISDDKMGDNPGRGRDLG